MRKRNYGGIGLAGSSISQESMKLRNLWHLFVRQTTVIEIEDPIRIGLQMMAHRNFRHLPVVKRDQRKVLLGMISAQDIIDLISSSYHSPTEASDNGNHLLSRLDESASTIMNDNPVTISRDETIFDAISIMSKGNIGALPILEGARERTPERKRQNVRMQTQRASSDTFAGLIGIITLRDIVSILGAFAPFGVRVEDYMTHEVFSVKEGDTIYSAANLMSKKKVRRLPVVSSRDGDRVEGMITNKMILRLLESCLSYRNLGIGLDAACKQLVRTTTIRMPLIDPMEDCGTAAHLMRELGTGGFAVSDSRGLLGIITERDLVRRIYEKEGLSFFSELFSKAQNSLVR